MVDRQSAIVMRLFESVVDISSILEDVLNEPSEVQRKILLRKLKVIKRRLPRLSEEIKAANRVPDPKIVTFSSLYDVIE